MDAYENDDKGTIRKNNLSALKLMFDGRSQFSRKYIEVEQLFEKFQRILLRKLWHVSGNLYVGENDPLHPVTFPNNKQQYLLFLGMVAGTIFRWRPGRQ